MANTITIAAAIKEKIINTIPIFIVAPAIPLAPQPAAITPIIIRANAIQNKLNIFTSPLAELKGKMILNYINSLNRTRGLPGPGIQTGSGVSDKCQLLIETSGNNAHKYRITTFKGQKLVNYYRECKNPLQDNYQEYHSNPDKDQGHYRPFPLSGDPCEE
jgi:hypothetical protein